MDSIYKLIGNTPLVEYKKNIYAKFEAYNPSGSIKDRPVFYIIKNAIKSYQYQEIPTSMYIHSWELTPEYFPQIKLPTKNKFITFHKIEKTFSKMNKLLEEFEFTSFNKYYKKIYE